MTPGDIYLIGSNQGSALSTAIQRALAPFGAKPQGNARGNQAHAHTKSPSVAVSYAAMSENPDGQKFMTALTAKLFGVPVHRFRVPGEDGTTSDAQARDALEGADIVFALGGDPVVGARLFPASGAGAWLREAHARGASLIGVSAGSILLASWWASWPDEPPKGAPFDGGTLVPCTGVAGDIVVDCHAEDEDWCELKLVRDMLLARNDTRAVKRRMLGLPHGGGIVLAPDGTFEPIGKGPFVLAEPDR